jgi:hypothetical protein
MKWFIEIKSSNNRPGSTIVGRSGNRVASRLHHEIKDHPDFAFPNEHTAAQSLVEAINAIRQKPVNEHGFTTEYKLALLKRLNNAEIDCWKASA